MTPREASKILGISYPTIKQWIYAGKLRTMKTVGGHHRISVSEVEMRLQTMPALKNRDQWKIQSEKISESNQLLGRILEIKVDGLIAQVRILIGDHRLTSIITADAASELRLKIGDEVVALLKSSQVMILRNQI